MMIFRERRIQRDREAGLVFDWRKGHRSFLRLLVSLVVVTLFCGMLYAYIKVEGPQAAPVLKRARAVTVINLERPENRWLADLIDRESPYVARWDVRDDTRLNEEVQRALGMVTVARHVPKLHLLPPEEVVGPTLGFPGVTALPEPEPVSWPKVARKPAKWWIEFESPGNEWSDYSIPWEDEQNLVSAGETWSFLLGLDSEGSVVFSIELEGKGSPSADALAKALKRAPFPEAKEALKVRWWKVLAVAVNRNANRKEKSQ